MLQPALPLVNRLDLSRPFLSLFPPSCCFTCLDLYSPRSSRTVQVALRSASQLGDHQLALAVLGTCGSMLYLKQRRGEA